MKWTWTHTIILFIVSIGITAIIYFLFNIFIFFILFIPPIIHIFKKK